MEGPVGSRAGSNTCGARGSCGSRGEQGVYEGLIAEVLGKAFDAFDLGQ